MEPREQENTPLAEDWERLDIPWLGILGVFLWLAGLYILILDPSGQILQTLADLPRGRDLRSRPINAPDVVNFQMIFIGLALTISGAIFIAAQWRPRQAAG